MRRVGLLFLLVFVLPFVCATSTSPAFVNIQIINDTSFTYNWYHDYSNYISGDSNNWTFYLENYLRDVSFYDNLGNLNVVNKTNYSRDTLYIVDTRYGKPGVIKGIYLNATGVMNRVDDDLIWLELPLLSNLWRGDYNETYYVNIDYPNNLELFTYSINSSSFYNANSEIKATYVNPLNYAHFRFIENGIENKFVEKKIGSKDYFIEDNKKLVESFDEAMNYRSFIWGYDDSKSDRLVIAYANLSQIEEGLLGLYANDNTILIHDTSNSKEEIASTILHELTHYSYSTYYGNMEFWGDVEEGFATYTEIKYVDKKFPNDDGNIPKNNWFFHTKPFKNDVEVWYDQSKYMTDNLYLFSKRVNWSNVNYYPIAGFVINYYNKNYGEDAFNNAVSKSNDLINKGTQGFIGLDYEGIFTLYMRGLIEAPEETISKYDLFFPRLDLYNSDREAFWRVMAPYVSNISEEEAREKYYVNLSESSSKDVKNIVDSRGNDMQELSNKWIIYLMIGAIVILVIVFIFIKKKSKKK